jgi:hypothetical protein
MPRPKSEIAAVLDEDLLEVLRRLGLADRLEQGKLKCSICDDMLDLAAIELIYPADTGTKLVCGKEACLLRFTLGGDDDTD